VEAQRRKPWDRRGASRGVFGFPRRDNGQAKPCNTKPNGFKRRGVACPRPDGLGLGRDRIWTGPARIRTGGGRDRIWTGLDRRRTRSVEAQRRKPWDRRGASRGVFGFPRRDNGQAKPCKTKPNGFKRHGVACPRPHGLGLGRDRSWTGGRGGGPVPWKPNGVSRGTGVVYRVVCLAFHAASTGKRNRATQSPMASSDMARSVPGLTALGLDGTGFGPDLPGFGPADEVADPFRGSPTA